TYQRTRARSLHRRRALVRVVSRGASPVTARCPIQIRSRPLVETKESGHLVNQFKKQYSVSQRLLIHQSTYRQITSIIRPSFQRQLLSFLYGSSLHFVGYGCIVYYIQGLLIHYLICSSVQMLVGVGDCKGG